MKEKTPAEVGAMKVYALWKKEGDYQYRWRTLLQFGSSWQIIGSVYMKNPGSAEPLNAEIPKHILDILKKDFSSKDGDWRQFSEDITMSAIEKLFTECYGKLNGVIQIFNLFNLKNPKLEDAIKILKTDSCTPNHLYTFEEDISYLTPPVYIGWGDLWKEPVFRPHQKEINQIFIKTKKLAEEQGKKWYLANSLADSTNHFYHPRYVYFHPQTQNMLVQNEKMAFIDMAK